MNLKKLSLFIRVDWELFAKEKELTVTGVTDWTLYGTNEHAGTKIEVCITKDETDYKTKNGEEVTNLMEKFKIKVKKDVNVKVGAKIQLVNPEATAYGEKKNGVWSNYKNQLSVTCDDIIVV